MPRHSRIVIPNIPHHVTQRGNYRQDIFKSDSDYEKYSLWFNEYAVKYKLGVLLDKGVDKGDSALYH